MATTHTMYLSTQTQNEMTQPVYSNQNRRVSWNVNWGDIFTPNLRGKQGQVYIRLISQVYGAAVTHDNTIGVVRANLGSDYSNVNNGIVLGMLELNTGKTAVDTFFLSCDTTQNLNAPIVSLPSGNSIFTLSLTGIDEITLLEVAVPDYQVIISFRVMAEDD